MDAFPPNSKKVKTAESRPEPEAKRVTQVTSSEANRRNKPLGSRFKETFIGGDAKTTINYVFLEILLPEAKSVIVDAFSQGFERLIFGEARGQRRSPSSSGYSNLGRTNYNSISKGMQQRGPMGGDSRRQMSPQARQNHNFGEIEVASRADANEVLDQMYILLEKYDYVTVADLYNLTGINANHVDQKWGWTSMKGSTARRTRNGDYVLDLPQPEWLDE